MYRMITDDFTREIVGHVDYDESTGKVKEVYMFGKTYTDPKEWKEKFGLPDNINC